MLFAEALFVRAEMVDIFGFSTLKSRSTPAALMTWVASQDSPSKLAARVTLDADACIGSGPLTGRLSFDAAVEFALKKD